MVWVLYVVAGVFLAMMAKTAVKVATESIGDYGVDFLIDKRFEI